MVSGALQMHVTRRCCVSCDIHSTCAQDACWIPMPCSYANLNVVLSASLTKMPGYAGSASTMM